MFSRHPCLSCVWPPEYTDPASPFRLTAARLGSCSWYPLSYQSLIISKILAIIFLSIHQKIGKMQGSPYFNVFPFPFISTCNQSPKRFLWEPSLLSEILPESFSHVLKWQTRRLSLHIRKSFHRSALLKKHGPFCGPATCKSDIPISWG